MSTFTYNGIQLDIVKTNFIERSPVMSEDRTEYLYTRFTLDIGCVYNPKATSYKTGPISASGQLAPTTDVSVRHSLLQPRKSLTYTVGGITMANIQPLNNSLDALDSKNGPEPISVSIVNVTNAKTFFVNYKITFYIVECPVGTAISVLASNRYSITEEINDEYRSEIVTTGKAIFKSDILNLMQRNADSFRDYIIPPPLLGYRRKRIRADIASDGLEIRWSVEDEEMMTDLGNQNVPGSAGALGITEINGHYGVVSIPQGPYGIAGMGSVTQMDIRAKGHRLSNNLDIFKFLMKMAASRLPIGGGNVDGPYLKDASIVEDVINRYVELRLSYIDFVGQNKNQNLVNGLGAAQLRVNGFMQIGAPVLPALGGQNPIPPGGNASRGTTPIELAVSSFRKACYTSLGENPVADGNIGDLMVFVQAGGPSGPPAPASYDDLPPGYNYYAGSNYTKYLIRKRKRIRSGKYDAPVAQPGQPINPDSPTTNSTSSSSSTYNGPTTEIMTLYAPQMHKVVEWEVERIGLVPDIPDPEPQDANYTLAGIDVQTIGFDLMPDGVTLIYRIAGEYRYYASNYENYKSQIDFDVPSWVGVDRLGIDTYVAASNYKQNMIDGAGRPTTGTTTSTGPNA